MTGCLFKTDPVLEGYSLGGGAQTHSSVVNIEVGKGYESTSQGVGNSG